MLLILTACFGGAMRRPAQIRYAQAGDLTFMHLSRFPLLPALLLLCTALTLPARAQGSFETTSALGRKLYSQGDDASVAAAQSKLAQGSGSAGDFLALSKAEAGRREYREAVKTDTDGLMRFPEDADLLLERGHRELGLREFVSAQKNLEHAVRVDASKLDAHYHLGLALYFQGQFKDSATHFTHARDLAKTDDSLIDCSNWLYVALRRAGLKADADAVLTRITPAVHNTEPHLAFYLSLLHFYQGLVTEQQILPRKPAPGDSEAELSYNTLSYGIGNWHLYNGEKASASAFFERVVAGEAWNSWGFVGSETELAHGR